MAPKTKAMTLFLVVNPMDSTQQSHLARRGIGCPARTGVEVVEDDDGGYYHENKPMTGRHFRNSVNPLRKPVGQGLVVSINNPRMISETPSVAILQVVPIWLKVGDPD